MTAPSVLGANTAILTSSSLPVAPTTNNPALIIYFNDIKTGDWDTASTTDIDAWILCLARKLFAFNTTATNENHSLVFSGKFFSVGTRNGISNRLTESYTLTAFGSTIPNGVDPDDLE